MRALLNQHQTLYDAAAAFPGARPIAGRGTAYAIRPEGHSWLVRHYRRGGAVARLLADRYVAMAGNRALHELRVSEAARARGLATPAVVAAACYRSGIFARFDIIVGFIDRARDLAQLLFEERIVSAQDVARAASLITDCMRHGLQHPDLNLKNVLLTPTAAYVLDLDGCALTDQRSPAQVHAMRRRFLRSLEKWQSRTGRVIADTHRRTLEAAFHV
ncbi:MAG: lipopolysaccharide kinase InaA family protein [Gemmatimonadota bacterium]